MSLFKILEGFGAIASISSWIMAYMKWQGDEQTKTLIATITGLLFAVLTLWAHRAKSYKDTTDKYDVLSDYLIVIPEPDVRMIPPKRHRNVYKINYPRPFKYLPNVKAESIRGGVKLILFDEKEDSFKIKIVRPTILLLRKVKVRWIAKGQFVD